MEAYKSIHNGEIGTHLHWLDRIADYNRETGEKMSLHAERENGNIVPVWLELSNHKMGERMGDGIQWTAYATDDDDNRYVITALCAEGRTPTWSDLDVISIEEED